MTEALNSESHILDSDYSYEYFEPKIDELNKLFDEIVCLLDAKNSYGKKISISVVLEATNPDSIKANAKRLNKDSAEYEVRMSAGMTYELWKISRFIMADIQYYDWLDDCEIVNEYLQKFDIKELLADFTFHLLVHYILLHEISHILLGHCDYLKDELGIEVLNEFDDNVDTMPEEIKRIRRAFEVEADRQAGEYLAAIFDYSLGSSGLGDYYTFPNREAVYEFYTYSVTTAFVLIQQLSKVKDGIHPLPNIRQQVVITAMEKYLNQYQVKDAEKIKLLSIGYMMDAGEKFGLNDANNPFKILENALELAWVDDVLNETKIRSYQHMVKTENNMFR